MIKLRDLQNRVYSDKDCIRFEYEFDVDKRKKIIAYFDRDVNTHTQWNMQVILGRTRDKDSDVYNFGYIMPKENIPLEIIAATGLKYFQLYLKEEIQEKSNIDFAIGEIIKGM